MKSVLLLLLFASTASAADLRTGELLLLAGVNCGSPGVTCGGTLFVDVHDVAGQYRRTVAVTHTPTFVANDVVAEGPVRVVVGPSPRLRRLHADGSIGEPFGPSFLFAASMTVDAEDTIWLYAGDIPGLPELVHLDLNGHILGRVPVPGLTPAFDLTADQCTLYYVLREGPSLSVQSLARFDVCTGQASPICPFNRLGTTTRLGSASFRMVC